MRLNDAKYTIELEKRELLDICYAMKNALLDSIKTHYNQLQQNRDGESVFDEQEDTEIRLLKELSNLSGQEIYENYLYNKIELFAKKRKERETK